ncbi:MAG: 50S ribosomal protein L23 [Anaerolineae bacterium]|nr:50S ribosomal protein L23 [Anaerolineae bacterium]
MNVYDVLKRPVDTEKARYQGALYEPQYSFEVDRRANKQQVKEAVQRIFEVDVVKVRIINVKPKQGRYGRRVIVRKPAWKKAIVTLAEGERLEIFEGV